MEFHSKIRELFEFLINDYDFTEMPTEAHHELEFQNDSIGVEVKGVHWGEGTMVYLRPMRDSPDSEFVSIPLWSIIKINHPELYEAFDAVDGQIPQAKISAKIMRETLAGLLAGDTSQLFKPRQFLEKRVAAVRNAAF